MSDQLVGSVCISQITLFFIRNQARGLVLQVSETLDLFGFINFLQGDLKNIKRDNNVQKQPPEKFHKKGALKSFTKFTRKQLG